MDVLNINGFPRSNKENKHSSPNKELQKLKIELNDRIFQCHRLEEDFAQERAKLVIDFQKERAHLNKTIKELREKNQADNEQWASKIDQIRREKQTSLATLASEFQQKSKEDKSKLKTEIQVEFKKSINQLKSQLASVHTELQRKCQKWKKQKEQAIQSLMISHSKKQDEMSRGYNATLEGIKKECQERITRVQYLYMKEQQDNRKLQKQIEDKVREHAKSTLILQGINNQLTRENEKLSQEIANLQTIIGEYKVNLATMEKSHEEQLKFSAQNHLQEQAQLKAKFQRQREQIMEIYNQQIAQVKSEVSGLESIYREKERLWDERGKKMLQMYEKRESKKQDVKAIEKLEVQLIKRDFMLQKERSQLKYCKLELENMEQIYDRMFLSNCNLNKTKTKSFKVKKLKTTMNSSNRSMIENRKVNFEDPK